MYFNYLFKKVKNNDLLKFLDRKNRKENSNFHLKMFKY